jgi:transposase
MAGDARSVRRNVPLAIASTLDQDDGISCTPSHNHAGRVAGRDEPPQVSYLFPILGRMARCQAGATARRPGAKAVRLVRDHVGDYATEWAAIKAVSGRLGMSAETLRKWLGQFEVEAGKVAGVTTESAGQIRGLKHKNAELERTIEILKEPRLSSCGSATRNVADLRVHCLATAGVRGRTDLPGTGCAGCADRPAHLPGAPGPAAVEAGTVGRPAI